jgi:glycosyltransferase involved in cell wall biosynthesis
MTAQHIGFEATRLLRERRGIGRYVRNMLRWIPRHREDVRFTLFVGSRADEQAVRQQLTTVDDALNARTTVEPVGQLRRTTADVVWYPWNYLNPAADNAAMVATINDIAPMLQFDHRWWKVLKRYRHKSRFRQTIDRADLVLTISEFSSQELQRLLAAPASKIRVTLLATDDLTVTANGHAKSLDRLGVTGPFFLTVGAHDARKNLATLYRAMELLHARGEQVPLVQCGPARTHHSHPFIKAAGYVDDHELATLYRLATALVFPSRYEGFGLPVAEAMSAGGRVICADASSLPEVVGSAGLLFPWHDAEALANQMSRMLRDEALRDQLTRDGLAQARKFTWSNTAQQTLAVFDEAVTLRRTRSS